MAQSNAGITPLHAYEFETPVKIVLMAIMWLGRLEFWPVLALFGFLVKR